MFLPEPIESPHGTVTAEGNTEAWPWPWPQTPQDFERLIDHFQDSLVRYAFRRTGCLAEAEDVVQEIFVKAFTQRTNLAEVTNVRPYLYRMTANLCTDRGRRKQKSNTAFQDVDFINEADGRPGAMERIAAAEELLRVNQLLERLPADQAEVLRLSVLDELSSAEIAEVLGTPVPTVKSRLRYGLEKLRRLIPNRKDARS